MPALDLDRVVQCPTFRGHPQATLRELIALLRATYCGTLGVEYMYISDKTQRDWLKERMDDLDGSKFASRLRESPAWGEALQDLRTALENRDGRPRTSARRSR